MVNLEHVQQLRDQRQRQQEMQAVWYRQILALAAGGLALLVGLQPPSVGVGKLFLAGTWVFLGVGICAGSAATYLEAHLAKVSADGFQSELLRALRAGTAPEISVSMPRKFFSWSRPVMVVSLLFAVLCLVVYAVVTTLGT